MSLAPDPAPRRHRARTVARSVALVLGAVAWVSLALGGVAPAGGAESPASTQVPSEPAGGGPVGDLDVGANTPSPRGVLEPSRAQRTADTVIAGGLLVLLVGGVAVAVWTARRGSSVPPEGAVGPPDREQ